MNTQTINIDSKKRIIKPTTKNAIEELRESLFLKWFGYTVFLMFPIISFIVYEKGNYILASKIIIFSVLAAVMFFIGYLTIITDKRHFKANKKNASIENKKGQFYHLNIAKEVKFFKGNGLLSGADKNLTGKHLLLSTENVKRMGATIGTTGSGKTEQLKGMFEQQVSLGGGVMVVEGKGTKDELKKLYSIVCKYGRLNDLFLLNFGNPKNTNSINIFENSSANQLEEILSELVETTETTWKVVINDFLVSILRLHVYERDKHGIIFGFNELAHSLSRTHLWEKAKKYRKNLKNDTKEEDLSNFFKLGPSFHKIVKGVSSCSKKVHAFLA